MHKRHFVIETCLGSAPTKILIVYLQKYSKKKHFRKLYAFNVSEGPYMDVTETYLWPSSIAAVMSLSTK